MFSHASNNSCRSDFPGEHLFHEWRTRERKRCSKDADNQNNDPNYLNNPYDPILTAKKEGDPVKQNEGGKRNFKNAAKEHDKAMLPLSSGTHTFTSTTISTTTTINNGGNGTGLMVCKV